MYTLHRVNNTDENSVITIALGYILDVLIKNNCEMNPDGEIKLARMIWQTAGDVDIIIFDHKLTDNGKSTIPFSTSRYSTTIDITQINILGKYDNPNIIGPPNSMGYVKRPETIPYEIMVGIHMVKSRNDNIQGIIDTFSFGQRSTRYAKLMMVYDTMSAKHPRTLGQDLFIKTLLKN